MVLKTERPVVLINPLYRANWEYIEDNPAAVLPLGILSIATVLSNEGYDVKIVDACTNSGYMREIEELISKKPLFIGLSVMTAQVYSALKIAGFIRRKAGSEIPLVWGGIHPTIFPESTSANPFVDVVVAGLGEYTCLDLAREYSVSFSPDLRKVPGVVFHKDGECVSPGPRRFLDINELPGINYDFVDIEKYIHRSMGYGDKPKKRSLILYTGIGCPFRCTFCANVALHNRRYSGKSAQRILDEIGFFKEKYSIEYFSFCDELFFVNKTRIQEFLDGMERRNYGIQWYANIRADCFKPDFLTEKSVEKMKKVGCNRLGMGVESGSQRILDEVLKKDIKLEYVLEAARLCSKYDITVGYSFMMGLPGETRDDTIKTLDLMNKIKKAHAESFFFGPQVYIPFPGSQLHRQAESLGFVEPHDLEGWGSIEANKSLQGKLSGEFLWNSFDPMKLPWITSIHAGLIRHIDFLQNFLFRRLRSLEPGPKFFLKAPLVLIARFRVRFKFWRFPLEYWLYKLSCLILRKLDSFKKKSKDGRIY